MSNYEENVAGFEEIDAKKAQELINDESETIIYIGMAVCPFCQKFVEKLKKVADETNTTIYYVDRSDKTDADAIASFREKYDIPTVPGFIYSKGDTVNVISDSSMSEDAIKEFMHK